MPEIFLAPSSFGHYSFRPKNIFEEYTQVKWNETLADGNIRKHSYMKDRIPIKRVKIEPEIDNTDWNWHLLEANFEKDEEGNFIDLVVPSTDEEKAATNYIERSVYKIDKGKYKKGDKLMRKILNPSYDESQTYVPRTARRKEWAIVGLLGQVPIRDTAIIPTSWKKMKNLESGIDLYYIK